MNWDSILQLERAEPRLWIETVWLLERTSPLTVTREVTLRRGLNLVWAQPASSESPVRMSHSGHGVGKSAFCQLLRYLLLDEEWADKRLKEELKYWFAEGGVAARVHVLGESWTVYLPYVHQRPHLAARDVSLEALLSNEVENRFDLYKQSLQEGLISDLPIKQLPADDQTIAWQHILPWCIRDQGGRFAGFYRWRAGRGAHLQYRAQSPPALVKIVLGVLQDATAYEDEARHQTELERLKRKAEELKRRPQFLKSHAEEALRRLAGTTSTTPFSRRDLLDPDGSTEALAEREIQNLKAEEARLAAQAAQADSRIADLWARWRGLWNERRWTRYFYLMQRAILKNTPEAVEKLRGQLAALKPPPGDCIYGDVPFSNCEYVKKREKDGNLDNAAKARELEGQAAAAKHLVIEHRGRYSAQLTELWELRSKKQQLRKQRREIREAAIEDKSKLRRIEDTLIDYRKQQAFLDGKETDTELQQIEQKHQSTEALLHSAKLEMRRQEHALRQRAERLTQTADALARAVFDDGEAFARFLPSDEKRLFQLGPREAEAFQVLEILIADLACLLDSSRLQSCHPGFLVHDSPREAELSDATFYRLMDVLSEIAVRFGELAPFQYIVTTTNGSMKESLRGLLCMPPLGSTGPDSYLFGKDLLVQRPLEAQTAKP